MTSGDLPKVASFGVGTGRVKIEGAVLTSFPAPPFPSLPQGALKTDASNVKFIVGPQNVVISHEAGSESTHPALPCVPTFANVFKFMFHRNS